MMNDNVTVAVEETTGYKIGYTIGTLVNLKRMVEINLAESKVNVFTYQEIMDMFDKAINKLRDTNYPYTV